MISPEYGNRPESLIGRPAKDVIQEIVRINPVSSLEFIEYIAFTNEPDVYYSASRDDVLSKNRIERLLEEWHPNGSLVGVASHVGVEGVARDSRNGSFICHIPMLDFTKPGKNQREDIEVIKWFLQIRLGQRFGWILSTGNGYHYYGARLLGPIEWETVFMREARIEGTTYDFVNRDFIEMALSPKSNSPGEQYASLRIGRNGLKPQIPIVVDILKAA